MILSTSLKRFLSIHSGEENKAWLAFLQAFCLGACHTLLQVIPLSLFLHEYPSSILPYIYIGGSICSLILGVIFAFLERRCSFFSLLLLMLFLVGFTLLFLNILASMNIGKIIFPFLLMWAKLATDMAYLEFWGVLNRIFSLEQAKRLFGSIGATSSLGNIFISFTLPILVQYISNISLLYITSIIFMIFMGILIRINSEFPKEIAGGAKKEVHSGGSHSIFHPMGGWTPYIKFLVVITFFSTVLYFPIDFAFNTLVQSKFSSSQQITYFLSLFFAAASFLKLGTRLVFFPFILKHFGVVISLALLSVLITPVAFLSSFFVFTDTPWLAFIFFGLIFFNKLIDEVSRSSILEPSKLLMYQVLIPSVRMWIHSNSEIIIKPIATLVASIFILLVSHYFEYPLVIMVLLTSILGMFLSFYSIGITKHYINALIESLQKRYFSSIESTDLEKNSQQIILKYLDSSYPGEVLYSLENLEQLDRDLFFQSLAKLLDHPSELVKEQALKKISQYHLQNYFSKAFLISKNPKEDIKVRSQALLAIAALTSSPNAKSLEPLVKELNSPILELKSAAIKGLLEYGDSDLFKRASSSLTALGQSDDPNERMEAASILGLVKRLENSPLLKTLLEDQNKHVKSKAILSVGTLPHRDYFKTLFKFLSESAYTDVVINSCQRIGPEIIPLFQEEFIRSESHIKIFILEILPQIKLDPKEEAELQLFLFQQLDHENYNLSYAVWGVLARRGFCIDKGSEASLLFFERELAHQSARLAYILDKSKAFQYREQFEFIYASLRRQLMTIEQHIYILFSCYYSFDLLKPVMEGMESNNPQQHAYAIELLQAFLTKKHAVKVLSKISKIHQVKESFIFQPSNQALTQILIEMAADEIRYLTEVLRASSLYLLYKIEKSCPQELIDKLIQENNPLLTETCEWILCQKRS